MRTRPLVMLMLDSLSDRYVQRGDVPYFSSRIADGQYTSIDSLFAFEGIMAAVITGKWPDESGVFARFAYDPEHSVMRRNPLRFLNRLNRHAYFANGERRDGRGNSALVKLIRKPMFSLWREGGFSNLTPYSRVPMALAPKFSYSMTLGAYDRLLEISGHETLFGQVHRGGGRAVFIYGPLPDVRRKLEALPDVDQHELIFVHTWSHLDSHGHELGPESQDLRAMTGGCDKELSEFLPWLEDRLKEPSFILFADHGMHPVHTAIDVARLVDRAIDETGPVVFVDSTLLRAWGEPEQLKAMEQELSSRQGVRLLSAEDLQSRHAAFRDDRYGQLFLAAEPGYVFAPDYFDGWHERKGMHGYFEDTEWQRPAVLWMGPGFDDLPADLAPADMTGVWRLARHALRDRELS